MAILFFCLGLAIGSFLRVAYYRYSPTQSLYEYLFAITIPRSSCQNCHHKLSAWQLIPVLSWLMLKRRCYYCYHKIANSYVIFELTIAILFLLIYLDKGLNFRCALLMLLVVIFLLLALIDINYLLLPDFLTQPLMWSGLIIAYFNLSSLNINDALVGILFGYLMLKLPAIIFFCITSKQGLGGGDIKLIAALGAWLPYQLLPLMLIIASTLAILYYSFSKYLFKKNYQLIAFGPFLLISGYFILYLN